MPVGIFKNEGGSRPEWLPTRVLVGLIVGLLTLVLASAAGLLVVDQVLDPAQLGPGAGGHQWADYHVNPRPAVFGLAVTKCDDNAGTLRGALRSELRLYEDGTPLGPSHSVDDLIRETGGGAYAYRCLDGGAVRGLIFSTSDNSDPRSNGRQYRVRYPVRMAPALFVASLGFGVAAILLLAARNGRFVSAWVWGMWSLALAATVQALAGGLVVPAVASYDPDTLGYLRPALSVLTGGPFALAQSRSFVYPGFVLAVLSVFGSIPALIYAQAVLCLATAVMVAALPLAATLGTRMTPLTRVARATLGAGLLVLFFHYEPMAYEVHAIRPEMLYTALSAALFLLLVLAFRLSDPSWLLACCGVGLYLTVANFYVRPSWGVAMIFSGGLFALRILFVTKAGPAVRVVVLAVSGVLAMTTLTWTNTHLSETYDRYNYKVFGPLNVFCHHVPLIITSLDRRIAAHQTDRDMPLVPLRSALAEVLTHYPDGTLLGYDPNICLWQKIGPRLRDALSDDPDRISAFLLRTFWRAALDNPLVYLAKVAKHTASALDRPLWDIDFRVSFDDEALRADAAELAGFPGLFADHTRFVGSVAAPLTSSLGIAVLYGLSTVFGGLLLVGGLMLLVDLASTRTGRRPVIRRWTPALLGFGLLFGSIVVVAMSATFDLSRYRYPLFPLALGTAAMIVQAALGMAMTLLRGVLPPIPHQGLCPWTPPRGDPLEPIT